MGAVIFANCAVLDGTCDERREDHHVLVEGGRIREVSDQPLHSAVAETIDLAGDTLMPGLIDAHVHAIAVDHVLTRLSERPPSLLSLQAARVLEGMLQRGFTTVRDAGGADGGLAEAVEQGLVRGPRIFPSGQALSQTGGHGDLRPRTRSVSVVACACCEGGAALARIADGVAECRRAARDELRKGATQIKIMASGGVASPYDPVTNLQYSEEEVRAIVEEARAWHTYVMAHAYTPAAISRSVEFGVRSIEHGNLIDEATAEQVASAAAFVVPTLVTFDALDRFGRELGFPEASLAKLGEVRAAGLHALEILQEAGVRIGFGTDLLGPMHRYQGHEFVIRAEAMAPIDIIRSATSVNAELLNRPGELGVVAPGGRADLIAVAGNPLADIALLDGQGERLTHIMKDGVFYKKAV
ncbi:MAG TPA: amidohydrolase family protein [Stellaceae bacterium]|nr:amidohydrolase family protein [Stellaceae bacterium]